MTIPIYTVLPYCVIGIAMGGPKKLYFIILIHILIHGLSSIIAIHKEISVLTQYQSVF